MLTLMLAPFSVTGGKIMNSSQEFEFVNRDLVGFDSKFLVEFAHSGSLDPLNGSGELCAGLACNSKGMLHIHVLDAGKLNKFRGQKSHRAAGICPQIGKSNLLSSSLLEQQTVLRVEQKYGESTVQKSAVNVCH
jgi:hypothetical protein